MNVDMYLLWAILFTSVGVAVAGVVPAYVTRSRPTHRRWLAFATLPFVGVLTTATLLVVAGEIGGAGGAAALPQWVWVLAVLAGIATIGLGLRMAMREPGGWR